ncbi:aminotransferase family protein [Solicola gregarius]|uniref:Aminotransferase class III-fold pyridoxal phosphate-dependent enzyme n=1 Tax=Solicola gregarius TaxID=2908642 RepID=A0AA46YJE5_9ACTN|nr:aminotransferase class III-fold pyridoxal phosphate-dependent enzyme [Solicola gregarius]UYM04455.1 aminotransferase class III-fold pyridoxal phosphate-dependent enzyme [Solicola gregarius]
MGALWHGFADMGAIERDGEFVIARGEGAYIWDTEGTRYLDATAGLWFANVGHGRTEIADAVAEQLRTIAAYSTFGDNTVDTTVELAERLATIAPVPGSKVFFTSGGSDSIDSAVKLARRYWHELGRPDKRIVLGREKAYHGMHVGGTALAGIPVNHADYGRLMDDAVSIGWDSGKALLEAIERIGADRIAAFFCEPVIGAGGIFPPPDGYLAEVRQICREHDILFVADEVITGFGRIGGSWFASSRFELEPDLMTTAKGLTSGYLPMGALFVAPRVSEPFFRPDAGVWWRHGYTYGGHAGSAAAAMANLDIIESEGLVEDAARLERTLHEVLAPLADHPSVEEVRSGVGAVAAVQLVDAGQIGAVATRLRGEGVSARPLGGGAIQLSPAFVMTDAQVGDLAAAIQNALPQR